VKALGVARGAYPAMRLARGVRPQRAEVLDLLGDWEARTRVLVAAQRRDGLIGLLTPTVIGRHRDGVLAPTRMGDCRCGSHGESLNRLRASKLVGGGWETPPLGYVGGERPRRVVRQTSLTSRQQHGS